jgi:hypothetical protein
MRDYPHRPDEAFLQTRLPKLARRIGISERAIPEQVAAGNVFIYDAAVDTAFSVARVQWALERPLDEVTATMRRTVTWVRDAVAAGFEVGPLLIDRWLEIAIIGGDPGTAATLVGLLDRGAIDLQSRGEAMVAFLGALRALLQGDRDGAAAAAGSLGQRLDAPDTDPATVQALVGLDRMIGATTTGDQAAFDQAVALRRQARAAAFGGSVQLRRHPDGLLDAAGASVARLAALRGRQLPPGDPYLATELLAAVPWPRTGG